VTEGTITGYIYLNVYEYHSILQPVTNRLIIIQQCKTREPFLSSIHLTLTISTRYSVPYATPHFKLFKDSWTWPWFYTFNINYTLPSSITIRCATAQI